MEQKIDLLTLSIDEITNKLVLLRSDGPLAALTLIVRRKGNLTHHDIKPMKSSCTPNLDILREKRKQAKQKKQSLPNIKDRKPSIIQSETKQMMLPSESEVTGQGLSRANSRWASFEDCEELQSTLDFIKDTRLVKVRRNYQQGNYDSAIETLIEMLDEVELKLVEFKDDSLEDKQKRIANLTFHLGNCYYKKKMYEKAIFYYSKEYTNENVSHKAMRKSNLGTIYLQLKKNQESLRNYNQALKIYSDTKIQQANLANIYHNVGNIYLREKMYEIASKYFEYSIEERKLKSPQAEVLLFYSAYKLGVCKKHQGKYEESLKMLFYALSFAERGVGGIQQVYKELAVVNEIVGRTNQALNYYEKICDLSSAKQNQKAEAYERAGNIYLTTNSNPNEGKKIMKIAQNFYERAGNKKRASYIRQVFGKANH